MEKSLDLVFQKTFNSYPEVFSSAPGRINIIGEHTDYNLGYVLPAAINLRSCFFLSRRSDNKVCLWAENFKKKDTFSLQKICYSEQNKWVNYVKGVFWALEEEDFNLQGINGLVWGDIPLEAGLSSSAALEVSIVQGLNTLFKLGLEPKKMVEIARRAENDFVGVKCGLMDQFISIFGQKNKALFLDCETLKYQLIPLELEKAGLQILVFDSNVRRELSSSEYNKRRLESSRALGLLKKYGINSYKDAKLSVLVERKDEINKVLLKRARHVISENNRVKKAVKAIKKSDFLLLGQLIFQSHKSLRENYEVSCPELDLLYDSAQEFSGCLGARLIGAGFGGSGIALIKKEKVDVFKNKLLKEAGKRGFTQPGFYEVKIGEGAQTDFLNKEGKE